MLTPANAAREPTLLNISSSDRKGKKVPFSIFALDERLIANALIRALAIPEGRFI